VQSLQKKAKTFSHENGTATKKVFHFRGSSAFVGDKFFLVPARPGCVVTSEICGKKSKKISRKAAKARRAAKKSFLLVFPLRILCVSASLRALFMAKTFRRQKDGGQKNDCGLFHPIPGLRQASSTSLA
jgi:hypothetical protein